MTTNQTPSSSHDLSVMHGGPLFNILTKFGMGHLTIRNTRIFCAAYVLVTWGVMAVLAALQGVFLNSSIKIQFAGDVSEMCRFLIAGPLIIAAEPVIEPWLRNTREQFRKLIDASDIPLFEKHVHDTRRLRDLWFMELLILCFALVRPHLDASILMLHEATSWQIINGVDSWANVWCSYVAKPIMGFLWLRWMWRYVVWSLLLCRIATLKMRLIPTHPDDTAGLGFVAIGQTKFSILVVALSTLAVGSGADQILYEGASFMSARWIIITVVLLTFMIFGTPLLAFTPKLIECKRRGLLEYGRLAQEYVEQFDEKWIENRKQVKDELLGNADIQSLSDLEGSYSIVQRMQVFIINRSFLATFALAAVMPFAPLALTMFSLEELVDKLLKNFV